jgi:hypothetical protein
MESYIQDTTGLLEPSLASPPGGPEEKYYWALGYGRDVNGLGTRDWYLMHYSNPSVTGGQKHTHTHSHRNPLISANHELYGPFDFNKMPLAPIGTKALVYNNPATGTSWVPRATDGFYVGPTTNHYRCLRFYIPATQCFCFSNTWHLYPSHCQVPTILEHNITLLLAAVNLLQQLGCAIPTTTTAKLKHLNAIRQLTTIMSGQPNASPNDPTSPRVVPAHL